MLSLSSFVPSVYCSYCTMTMACFWLQFSSVASEQISWCELLPGVWGVVCTVVCINIVYCTTGHHHQLICGNTKKQIQISLYPQKVSLNVYNCLHVLSIRNALRRAFDLLQTNGVSIYVLHSCETQFMLICTFMNACK